MSRAKPAVVRFYLDADVLGLAHVVAALRSDTSYPGDPGAIIGNRGRKPGPSGPSRQLSAPSLTLLTLSLEAPVTTSHFIQSADALAPDLRLHAWRRVVGVNVELEDGSQVALGSDVTAMLDLLLSGLRDGKIAHLELDEELVSPERAAELLGVSRPTVYAWQDRGRLARQDQGSRRMVPLSDIRRYKDSPVRAAAANDSPLTPEEIGVLNEARTAAPKSA